MHTTPSGVVDMVFNVILQSPPSSDFVVHGGPSALLERLSATTLVNSVNQVLAAFRRAHERMIAAKQGLKFTAELTNEATQ